MVEAFIAEDADDVKASSCDFTVIAAAGDDVTASSRDFADTAAAAAGDDVTASSRDFVDTAAAAGDDVTASSRDFADTAAAAAGDDVTASSRDFAFLLHFVPILDNVSIHFYDCTVTISNNTTHRQNNNVCYSCYSANTMKLQESQIAHALIQNADAC